jgi:hypothetical protein
MRQYGKHILTVAATLALPLGIFTAHLDAYPRHHPNVVDDGNRWEITAFLDNRIDHLQLATQGICFQPFAVVGTQIQGVWYSDTFPDWNGQYTQEGDHVQMHGDYARDVGHDGMTFQIHSHDRGAGHWFEWREDGAFGNTIGFGNMEINRVGKCDQVVPLPQPPYTDLVLRQYLDEVSKKLALPDVSEQDSPLATGDDLINRPTP